MFDRFASKEILVEISPKISSIIALNDLRARCDELHIYP
jgi:hypothetical protein